MYITYENKEIPWVESIVLNLEAENKYFAQYCWKFSEKRLWLDQKFSKFLIFATG